MNISASTIVAAVVGSPVAHSLSPLIHNAWIEAARLDALYVALQPSDFRGLAQALRGGILRGLNVTAPFKADALAMADTASERAWRAGAANLLIFETDGATRADNTDGQGLLAAFAEQAPEFDPAAGPITIIGSGGAARGAAAALVEACAPAVRIVSRSPEKALALAASLGGVVTACDLHEAVAGSNALINATPIAPSEALQGAPSTAVVMDMVYRPLETAFLAHARARGMRVVDGLAMLIGQARPSFEALFGVAPPATIDIRGRAIAYMESAA